MTISILIPTLSVFLKKINDDIKFFKDGFFFHVIVIYIRPLNDLVFFPGSNLHPTTERLWLFFQSRKKTDETAFNFWAIFTLEIFKILPIFMILTKFMILKIFL